MGNNCGHQGHLCRESTDQSAEISVSEDFTSSEDETHHHEEEHRPDAEANDLVLRIRACLGLQKPPERQYTVFVPKDELLKAKRDTAVHHKVLTADTSGKSIDAEYLVQDKNVLGTGGYATVCKGLEKRTGHTRAIKRIMKSMIPDRKRLQQEIEVMLALDHPNIIKLFQTFEDSRCIYLVMELCTGGELFDRIIEVGHLTEPDAATIMQQILRAIFYCHEHGICHRDLKPENFLFQDKSPIQGNTLKCIDFGIAGTFNASKPRDQPFRTKTGTPFYVAPEVLSQWGQYGPACDLWSCGVIAYILLSGTPPFQGKNDQETLQKVSNGAFQFPKQYFGSVSEPAKELIKKLLVKDVSKRMTAVEALAHPWITTAAVRVAAPPIRQGIVDSLRNFRSTNKMKKVALQVVARHIDEDKIHQLRDIFLSLDTNGDGMLTLKELSDGLQSANLNLGSLKEELRQVVAEIDADGSGEIDYSEFLAATLEEKQYVDESACWAAFRVFDKDGDGRITLKELQQVLNKDLAQKMSEDNLQQLMNEVDADGDGGIDFEEFMAMMRR